MFKCFTKIISNKFDLFWTTSLFLYLYKTYLKIVPRHFIEFQPCFRSIMMDGKIVYYIFSKKKTKIDEFC